jgi:hypothetical protein
MPQDPNKRQWVPAGPIANVGATVGTPGTVADVGAAFTQATLNNNFRTLSDKIDAILQALRDAGKIST